MPLWLFMRNAQSKTWGIMMGVSTPQTDALQSTVKKTRAGPAGSFTQLYWRLCINTHAHFKCKPKWTQVQPNLEIPVMSSCKDVWIIFTKKSPKTTEPSFLKNIPSLTRAQARLLQTSVYVWTGATFAPDASRLAEVFKYIVCLLLNAYI